MADTKISALTAASAAAGTNEIPINEAGTTKKVTVAQIFGLLYPVGSIYISTLSTNPATLLGVGTWSAFAAGKTLVGLDSKDTDFDTAEDTGGAKTHTLSVAEMPTHHHSYVMPSGGGSLGAAGTTANAELRSTEDTGSGNAHNNLQPYIVVYMWKRTA